MKSRVFTLKRPACSGALVFGLLLGAFNASVLHISNGVGVSPAIAGLSPVLPVSGAGRPKGGRDSRSTRPLGQITLTPAAPVSSRVPASSGEDIRDIRQPRHNPTPPPWVAVAAGVISLVAAAVAVWRWIRRGKFLEMPPHEIALQYLEDVRPRMDPDHAREYCFAVSKIIRRYIEERFHVQAPTLATEAFLRDLVAARETMRQPHRALLGEFLQHGELAKLAGWRYSLPDLEAMHASAKAFVHQTAAEAAASGGEATFPGAGRTATEFPARPLPDRFAEVSAARGAPQRLRVSNSSSLP